MGGIEIEGAVDYACGRPREHNPYNAESVPECWAAWDAGWEDAASLFPLLRLEQEKNRWTSES